MAAVFLQSYYLRLIREIVDADDPFSVKEKALLFLFIAILFVFIGSGRYAIDSLLERKS